jgi:outer membrane immunogenic protein
MRNCLIVVALCCPPAVAEAADLGAPPPAAPYNWTGAYLGVNGGGGWENTKTDYSYSSITAPNPPGFEDVFGPNSVLNSGGPGPLNVTGDAAVESAISDGYLPVSLGSGMSGFGVFGAQIGYNYQVQQVVFGVEADIDWASGGRSTTFAAPDNGYITNNAYQNAGLQWLGTARLRAGYAADRALFFATGGLAFGGVKASSGASAFDGSNTDLYAGSSSGTKTGYAVGGGVEYALTANATLKAEYLFYDLGSANYAVSAANMVAQGEGLFINAHQRLDGDLLRLGLNLKY